MQQLQVLDLTGKVVREIHHAPASPSELSLDLSQLSSGIYLIRANISGEWQQQKLTIADQ